ncbi:hypothetical protein NNU90_002300 [Citrobacter farmeri]|nr:hypothetical protein [Citrobacter farmeri]
MPVATIITDALSGMTPMVDGKRNEFLMQQVCGLARGELSDEQINQILTANHIEREKIANSPLILLVNHDLLAQQMTCAAYLATSLSQPVDVNAYFSQKPAEEKVLPAKAGSLWHSWFNEQEKMDRSGEMNLFFDSTRFMADMRIRLAIAKATAQLYAVVAANLATTVPLSWGEYQQRVAEIMADYAGEYIRTVKDFYLINSKLPVVVEQIQGNNYRLKLGASDRLEQSDGQTQLYLDGVMWLGEGKIFGKMARVPVTLIATPTREVSANDKASTGGQTEPQHNKINSKQ